MHVQAVSPDLDPEIVKWEGVVYWPIRPRVEWVLLSCACNLEHRLSQQDFRQHTLVTMDLH